jgi:hypothetical protein
MTTIQEIILLKRDPKDKSIVTRLNAREALQYLTTNNLCNPHQLVKDERKLKLRRDFFYRYLKQTSVRMVNTKMPPHETQQKIRKIIKGEAQK